MGWVRETECSCRWRVRRRVEVGGGGWGDGYIGSLGLKVLVLGMLPMFLSGVGLERMTLGLSSCYILSGTAWITLGCSSTDFGTLSMISIIDS